MPQDTAIYNDPYEIRVAVRIPSNPKKESEYAYMVTDSSEIMTRDPQILTELTAKNPEKWRIKFVHDTIPLSQYDEKKKSLISQYADVEEIGYTYYTEPYFLGMLRNGTKLKMYNSLSIQQLMYKPNYIRTLCHYFEMDLEQSSSDLITKVSKMSQVEYADYANGLKEQLKQEANKTLSEEEIIEAASVFYGMDALQEKLAHRKHADEIVTLQKALYFGPDFSGPK